MLQWLSSNHDVLSLTIDAVLLVVWLTYLQTFLAGYRQQRRPKILINRGGGHGLRSRCLISNMSSEAIYIESIVASVERDGKHASAAVTDLEDLGDDQLAADPKKSTRQGPLGSGDYMDVGDFGDLLDRVRRTDGELQSAGEARDWVGAGLELQVIATYGSEKLLVAGRRGFDLVEDRGEVRPRPRELATEQVTSRRQRRRIAKMLRQHL